MYQKKAGKILNPKKVMKKLIESELISIAHRILKFNDKTDLQSLLTEARKVYEKLTVLQFYQENKSRLTTHLTDEDLNTLFISQQEEITLPPSFSEEKEKIRVTEIADLAVSFIKEEAVTEREVSHENESVSEIIQKSSSEEEIQDDIHAPYAEKTEDETQPFTALDIDPVYNISFDEIEFEQKTPPFNGTVNPEPVPAEVSTPEAAKNQVISKVHTAMENQHFLSTQSEEKDSTPFHQIPLNRTINDAFSKMITIGLNDRIAFEKHLFNNSSEDLNRVISQLNTIETYQEAQDFIEDLVKPDFNNWQGKEEYAARFITMIEKRFL